MERWLNNLRAGDKKALAYFFDEYYAKVFNFCYSFLRSKEEAEEVTQDVFLKIWNIRGQIDAKRSIDSLLFKIAKNLTLNRIRDNKKLLNMTEVTDSMKIGDSIMEVMLYREMEDILKKGIEELPERRKMIFELSRFEGLSNKEISAKMNISVNTVEGQIRKAIKQLHEHTSNIFD